MKQSKNGKKCSNIVIEYKENMPLLFSSALVGVEALPRIFLNNIYSKTNKLDKYVNNNNIQGIRIIEVLEQDECTKGDVREECLRRLKREPTEDIRRLSKQSFVHDKAYVPDSSEDNKRTIYGYNSFSQDYLDVNDLVLRSDLEGILDHSLSKQKPKKKKLYKVLRPNKYDRFTFDLSNFRRYNRKKKGYDSDDSDSSTSSESRETTRNKIAKNKRFQIADKSLESETESSDEIRIVKKKPIKKSKGKLMYMQSPTRLYDGRRRLQHFLRKRYHWDEDDIRQLSNYWFSGPQGKYRGTVD